VPGSKAGRRRYGVAGLCLLALALAFSLGSLGPAHAATILLVDDDLAECPSAAFSGSGGISDAIAAASDGDTIVVCPGTYDATTVDRRVTLSGYTSDLSKKNRCADRLRFPADQATKDSIVAGFTVTADFVVIKGFTLTAPGNGVMIPGPYSDATVTRNVFQDNPIGVNLNGTESLVDHNCFRDNNAPGSASGTGIYSDQGLQGAVIDANVFVDNISAAITLLDTPGAGSLDHVRVRNNVSSGDGDLVSIAGSTNSEIRGNRSTGSAGSGIFLEAGVGGPNSTLTVLGNSLRDGGDEGIYAEPGALADSTVKGNSTKGNASFGIHVDTGNTGNLISGNNFANGGAAFDCRDDSAPGNTWKNDKGKTSLPAGICKKK
jgi:nitrous oxidase accessory protein NosD